MLLFEMLHLLQVISYLWKLQWKKSPGLEISIFGSWFVVFLNFWLVVIPVENFLGRGGSWWLVVGRGGSYDLLDMICPDDLNEYE